MPLVKILTRRKTDEAEGERGGAKLRRALRLGDLTMLGVGSTLGVGVYVLAGSVARQDAGPAVVISFLIAAIASAFAGVCYAEFAARVPKAGSAYVYSYVTVGELAAFIIGWNLILEYVIGTASVARGLSNYIDSLLNKTMSSALLEVMPIHVSWLSSYPDFLSCCLIILLSFLLAWGVRESSLMNNLFTSINLCTVTLVIVAGAFFINVENWSLDPGEAPAQDPEGHPVKPGMGGFTPFGISGIMAGAAKCFYAFVGFDIVATTGEEAKNPIRDIPLSILFALTIIFFAYFGISSVLTLMYPYYLQDVDAPLPFVFGRVGLPVVSYIVSTGAIFALSTSLLGALFPLPRVVYSMSHDGLLFEFLSRINTRTLTPIWGTLCSGLFAGLMALIFNVDQLIDMMSIGTLLAYSIVAICVLILSKPAYSSPMLFLWRINIKNVFRLFVTMFYETWYREPDPDEQPNVDHPDKQPNVAQPRKISPLKKVFNLTRLKNPNSSSESVSCWAFTIYIVATVVLCVTLVSAEDAMLAGVASVVTWVCFLVVVMVITVFIVYCQPQAKTVLVFKAPFLPLLPCVSILINFYLMCKLDFQTWVRFGVWLFAGMLMYLFYSIPNSVEGIKSRQAASSTNQIQDKSSDTNPPVD